MATPKWEDVERRMTEKGIDEATKEGLRREFYSRFVQPNEKKGGDPEKRYKEWATINPLKEEIERTKTLLADSSRTPLQYAGDMGLNLIAGARDVGNQIESFAGSMLPESLGGTYLLENAREGQQNTEKFLERNMSKGGVTGRKQREATREQMNRGELGAPSFLSFLANEAGDPGEFVARQAAQGMPLGATKFLTTANAVRKGLPAARIAEGNIGWGAKMAEHAAVAIPEGGAAAQQLWDEVAHMDPYDYAKSRGLDTESYTLDDIRKAQREEAGRLAALAAPIVGAAAAGMSKLTDTELTDLMSRLARGNTDAPITGAARRSLLPGRDLTQGGILSRAAAAPARAAKYLMQEGAKEFGEEAGTSIATDAVKMGAGNDTDFGVGDMAKNALESGLMGTLGGIGQGTVTGGGKLLLDRVLPRSTPLDGRPAPRTSAVDPAAVGDAAGAPAPAAPPVVPFPQRIDEAQRALSSAQQALSEAQAKAEAIPGSSVDPALKKAAADAEANLNSILAEQQAHLKKLELDKFDTPEAIDAEVNRPEPTFRQAWATVTADPKTGEPMALPASAKEYMDQPVSVALRAFDADMATSQRGEAQVDENGKPVGKWAKVGAAIKQRVADREQFKQDLLAKKTALTTPPTQMDMPPDLTRGAQLPLFDDVGPVSPIEPSATQREFEGPQPLTPRGLGSGSQRDMLDEMESADAIAAQREKALAEAEAERQSKDPAAQRAGAKNLRTGAKAARERAASLRKDAEDVRAKMKGTKGKDRTALKEYAAKLEADATEYEKQAALNEAAADKIEADLRENEVKALPRPLTPREKAAATKAKNKAAKEEAARKTAEEAAAREKTTEGQSAVTSRGEKKKEVKSGKQGKGGTETPAAQATPTEQADRIMEEIDSIVPEGFVLVVHQTAADIAHQIAGGPGFSAGVGVNGSVLTPSRAGIRDVIAKMLGADNAAQLHGGSGGYVVMAVPETWFAGRGRDIASLDNTLMDMSETDPSFAIPGRGIGIPNRYIVGAFSNGSRGTQVGFTPNSNFVGGKTAPEAAPVTPRQETKPVAEGPSSKAAQAVDSTIAKVAAALGAVTGDDGLVDVPADLGSSKLNRGKGGRQRGAVDPAVIEAAAIIALRNLQKGVRSFDKMYTELKQAVAKMNAWRKDKGFDLVAQPDRRAAYNVYRGVAMMLSDIGSKDALAQPAPVDIDPLTFTPKNVAALRENGAALTDEEAKAANKAAKHAHTFGGKAGQRINWTGAHVVPSSEAEVGSLADAIGDDYTMRQTLAAFLHMPAAQGVIEAVRAVNAVIVGAETAGVRLGDLALARKAASEAASDVVKAELAAKEEAKHKEALADARRADLKQHESVAAHFASRLADAKAALGRMNDIKKRLGGNELDAFIEAEKRSIKELEAEHADAVRRVEEARVVLNMDNSLGQIEAEIAAARDIGNNPRVVVATAKLKAAQARVKELDTADAEFLRRAYDVMGKVKALEADALNRFPSHNADVEAARRYARMYVQAKQADEALVLIYNTTLEAIMEAEKAQPGYAKEFEKSLGMTISQFIRESTESLRGELIPSTVTVYDNGMLDVREVDAERIKIQAAKRRVDLLTNGDVQKAEKRLRAELIGHTVGGVYSEAVLRDLVALHYNRIGSPEARISALLAKHASAIDEELANAENPVTREELVKRLLDENDAYINDPNVRLDDVIEVLGPFWHYAPAVYRVVSSAPKALGVKHDPRFVERRIILPAVSNAKVTTKAGAGGKAVDVITTQPTEQLVNKRIKQLRRAGVNKVDAEQQARREHYTDTSETLEARDEASAERVAELVSGLRKILSAGGIPIDGVKEKLDTLEALLGGDNAPVTGKPDEVNRKESGRSRTQRISGILRELRSQFYKRANSTAEDEAGIDPEALLLIDEAHTAAAPPAVVATDNVGVRSSFSTLVFDYLTPVAKTDDLRETMSTGVVTPVTDPTMRAKYDPSRATKILRDGMSKGVARLLLSVHYTDEGKRVVRGDQVFRSLARLAAGYAPGVKGSINERLPLLSQKVAAINRRKEDLFSELWVATLQRSVAVMGLDAYASTQLAQTVESVLAGTPVSFNKAFLDRVNRSFVRGSALANTRLGTNKRGKTIVRDSSRSGIIGAVAAEEKLWRPDGGPHANEDEGKSVDEANPIITAYDRADMQRVADGLRNVLDAIDGKVAPGALVPKGKYTISEVFGGFGGKGEFGSVLSPTSRFKKLAESKEKLEGAELRAAVHVMLGDIESDLMLRAERAFTMPKNLRDQPESGLSEREVAKLDARIEQIKRQLALLQLAQEVGNSALRGTTINLPEAVARFDSFMSSSARTNVDNTLERMPDVHSKEGSAVRNTAERVETGAEAVAKEGRRSGSTVAEIRRIAGQYSKAYLSFVRNRDRNSPIAITDTWRLWKMIANTSPGLINPGGDTLAVNTLDSFEMADGVRESADADMTELLDILSERLQQIDSTDAADLAMVSYMDPDPAMRASLVSRSLRRMSAITSVPLRTAIKAIYAPSVAGRSVDDIADGSNDAKDYKTAMGLRRDLLAALPDGGLMVADLERLNDLKSQPNGMEKVKAYLELLPESKRAQLKTVLEGKPTITDESAVTLAARSVRRAIVYADFLRAMAMQTAVEAMDSGRSEAFEKARAKMALLGYFSEQFDLLAQYRAEQFLNAISNKNPALRAKAAAIMAKEGVVARSKVAAPGEEPGSVKEFGPNTMAKKFKEAGITLDDFKDTVKQSGLGARGVNIDDLINNLANEIGLTRESVEPIAFKEGKKDRSTKIATNVWIDETGEVLTQAEARHRIRTGDYYRIDPETKERTPTVWNFTDPEDRARIPQEVIERYQSKLKGNEVVDNEVDRLGTDGKAAVTTRWDARRETEIRNAEDMRRQREAEQVERALNGADAGQALDFLANKGPGPAFRAMASAVRDRARQMMDAGVKINFEFAVRGKNYGSKILEDLNKEGADGAFAGNYRTGDLHVVLAGSAVRKHVGAGYEVALHEFIHAITHGAIALGQNFRDTSASALVSDLNALYDHVKNRVKEKADAAVAKGVGAERLSSLEHELLGRFFPEHRYNSPAFGGRAPTETNRLEDLHELVTWGLTDPATQEWLRSIAYKNKPRGVLGAMFSAIRKYMNIPENEESAFTELLSISDAMFSIDPVKLGTESRARLGGKYVALAYNVKEPKDGTEGPKTTTGRALNNDPAGIGNSTNKRDISTKLLGRLKGALENPKRMARRRWFGVARMSEVEEVYGKDIPFFGQMREALDKVGATASKHIEKGAEMIHRWELWNNSVSADTARALSNLMLDATFSRIYADRVYYSKDEFIKDHPWHSGSNDAYALYRDLHAQYVGLGDGGRVYDEVAAYFKKAQAELKAAAIKRAEDTNAPGPDRDSAVRAVEQMFREAEQGPYFPLARFGDYIIDGSYMKRDADGVEREYRYNYAFETAAERDAALEEINKRGWPAPRTWEASNVERSDFELTTPVLNAMFKRMATGDADMDRKLKLQLLDVQRSASRETGVLARSMQRKYVQGASNEMMKAVAKSMYANAHFLARTVHATDVIDAVNAAKRAFEETKQTKDGKVNPRQALVQDGYEEVLRRYNLYLAPPSANQVVGALADGINRTTTTWLLTSSPAYPVVNLLQTAIFTAPYLYKRFPSHKKIYDALKTAGDDALSIDLQPFLAAMDSHYLAKMGGVERAMANAQRSLHDAIMASERLTDDEKRLLVGGLEKNWLDVSMIYDAMGAADPRSGAGKLVHAVSDTLSVIPHHTETFNRITSALAAYRLQRDHGKLGGASAETRHKLAVNYAEDVVDKTHFNYSDLTGSRYMSAKNYEGEWGQAVRVLMQMKAFTYNSLFRVSREMYVGLLKRKVEGMSEEEKAGMAEEVAGARRFLAAQSLGLIVLAGGLGLPFVSSLIDLTDALRDFLDATFGHNNRAPADTRADIVDILDGDVDPLGVDMTPRQRLAEGLLRGPAAAANLTTGQMKLGLNSILPGSQDVTNLMKDATPLQSLGAMLATSFPASALATKAWAAKNFAMDGSTYNAVAAIAPKGMSDVMIGAQGYSVSQSGKRSPGVYSWDERLVRMGGMPVAKDVRFYEQQSAQMNESAGLRGRLDDLKRRYQLAFEDMQETGDRERFDESMRDLIDFANENLSMADQVQTVLDAPEGIMMSNYLRGHFPQMGGANPEAEDQMARLYGVGEDDSEEE